MDKKTRRILSIFLIIFLFFVGMYADAVPVKDLSSCSLPKEASASLAPVHSDINNDAIGTTESPALHNTHLHSKTGYEHQYREVNEFLSLQRSGFQSTSHGKFSILHTTSRLFYQTQKERITEYVYSSDGKKRI